MRKRCATLLFTSHVLFSDFTQQSLCGKDGCKGHSSIARLPQTSFTFWERRTLVRGEKGSATMSSFCVVE